MKRVTLILSAIIWIYGLVSARSVNDTTEVFFRQSKSALDLNLRDNGGRLNEMLEQVRTNSAAGSGLKVARIKVLGAASPEGSVEINHRLSEQRAAAILNYFSQYVQMPDSLTEHEYVGRDWSGLHELVENDSAVPYRKEVLELIENIISEIARGGGDDAENIEQLRNLRGGEPYRYMYFKLFPTLRMSSLCVAYAPLSNVVRCDLAPMRFQPTVAVTAEVVPVAIVPAKETKGHKPFYMALKTNLLYDAAALPNLSAEFYLGKNWSITGNWMYGWWDNDSRHRYWRAYGGDITVRRWFGSRAAEKPLTGHHIGVYAGVVTYDFEFGGRGYMGGLPGRTLWDRCNTVAGVEYGYSLPIGKRLNIDFTIGIGYLGGKYLEYVPKDNCYEWQSTHRLNWFGPTKAEISLVWLIGRGNYNHKGR